MLPLSVLARSVCAADERLGTDTSACPDVSTRYDPRATSSSIDPDDVFAVTSHTAAVDTFTSPESAVALTPPLASPTSIDPDSVKIFTDPATSSTRTLPES